MRNEKERTLNIIKYDNKTDHPIAGIRIIIEDSIMTTNAREQQADFVNES